MDDAVQDVLTHLLENDSHALRAYRGDASLEGYLGMLAVYRVLKARPAQSRPVDFDSLDPAPGPSKLAERKELRALLEREVSRLSPQARLALTLRCDGAPVREVGQALGVSEGAAAQILSRARKSVMKRLPDGS